MTKVPQYAGPDLPRIARKAPPLANVVAIVLALSAAGIAFTAGFGVTEYLAGVRNDAPFWPGRVVPLMALSLLLTALLAVWVLVWIGRGVRGWYLGPTLLMLAILAMPISCVRFNTLMDYNAGFARWADENVDVEAVRAWLATGPAGLPVNIPASGRSAQSVPPNAWPESITSISPAQVYLLEEGGVILSWGIPAEFNDRRGVYIAPAADDPAPPDLRWFRRVEPGMYAASY